MNATRPPWLRAATISGVASSPPRSPIATGAEPITVGDAIVARCAQVRPSITRITPNRLGSLPLHDSPPWSVPLYDANTIDGVAGSSSVATIGVASTLDVRRERIAAGGAAPLALLGGEERARRRGGGAAPVAGAARSDAPRAGTLRRSTSQYWSPVQSALAVHAAGGATQLS